MRKDEEVLLHRERDARGGGYLAFTNATAFSPTEVMSLAPWANIAMAVQSLLSLGILGRVIARAVNVFT
jgi:hypothetical protein